MSSAERRAERLAAHLSAALPSSSSPSTAAVTARPLAPAGCAAAAPAAAAAATTDAPAAVGDNAAGHLTLMAQKRAAFQQNPPPRAAFLQHGSIPFFDIRDASEVDAAYKAELHAAFFDGAGCLGLKRVFAPGVMDRYNAWCEGILLGPGGTGAANMTHPKQPDKFVINDLLERLSVDDPSLLMELIANPVYNAVMDALLGFMTIGAITTHWIKPHGARQRSHVDFPLHVGSGKFWEASPAKMMRLTTPYQLDHVLPYYSVQAIVASDAMDAVNGSTECVPFSQHIPGLDRRVHEPGFYASMEGQFVNTTLGQGDVFIFNRGLCHRGGRNTTGVRRNSCIMQCVWLWGIGQHKIDADAILGNLRDSGCASFAALTPEQLADLTLRLKKPYPIDTTVSN